MNRGIDFHLNDPKTGWIVGQGRFDSRQFYLGALVQAAESQRCTLEPTVDMARYERAVHKSHHQQAQIYE